MSCQRSLFGFCIVLLFFQSAMTGWAQTADNLAKMETRCIERIAWYRDTPISTGYLKLVGANDKVLDAMRGLQNVERLSLICVCRFTDDGIKPLSTIRGIRRLSIGSPNSIFTGSGLVHLDEMPTIETLTLMGPITDLRGLRNFPNLKSLDVARCTLDDSAMASLARVPKLEVLKIRRSPQITDAGAAHLSQLRNLRELQLLGTSIGDDGIAHINQLSHLEQLSVSSQRMTRSGLESISQLKRLQSLSVYFYEDKISGRTSQCLRGLSELTDLTWYRIPMTDEQTACFSQFSGLRNLTLTDPTVDDRSLAVLSRIPTLERLKLVDSSITPAGLKHLGGADQLKHVIIYFPEYLHRDDVIPLRHLLQDRYPDEGQVGFVPKR